MSVKVVHLQKAKYTDYIGRRVWPDWGNRGLSLPESIFHNPFRIGRDGTREEVILKFAEYWYAPEQWDLRRAAWRLSENAVLGCWCKPEACHGDIIAGYLNWIEERQQCLNL
jgi:hypothetical protein